MIPAEGGILLIGVPEMRDPNNGKPTGAPDVSKFAGIEVPNPESVLVGYDSRVVSCIEDRLSLETHAIKLSNGRYVFAIRVPNSLNKPHCVRRDDKRYFPSRRDRHIYYMDVQEIKELVMRTASRQEQAEQSLQGALKEVRPQGDAPLLVIGTIPVFSANFLVDLREQKILNAMQRFDLVDESSNLRMEIASSPSTVLSGELRGLMLMRSCVELDSCDSVSKYQARESMAFLHSSRWS